MLDVQALQATDLQGLSPSQVAEVFSRMLAHIDEQDQRIDSQAQAIKLRDAKLERVTFELARLKAWKFAARTERMNDQQRQLFEETLAADEANLQAQLEALQQHADTLPKEHKPRIQPKRQILPEHLQRVVHTHEPETTTCSCGQPMRRIGEDMSERLDVVPAQFFVHRHIRGKWACKCCERLVQDPVDPHIIDGGMPAAGLVAHTLVSRFVDHLPYYRQEQINARSGVHTPRSTLAAWSGRGGAALMPLYEAQREFVLGARVLHADETPVEMLDPGAGKTRKAYVWAYARGAFDAQPGVIYDFRCDRGAKYPAEFLRGWSGTLVRDEFKGYETVLKLEQRLGAGCLAHARRKFDELIKTGHSPVAAEAVQRIGWIYRLEREAQGWPAEQRLAIRQTHAKPAWDALLEWLRLERTRVPDGSGIARAIDYSLNHWGALTVNLGDGDVPVDNNHIENLMRPWAMGRKAWLFAGSQLAGQRAAIVMSLVQSVKLNGHDPWAYLKDVLNRLPTHLNSRIDELLPHIWQPAH
ncbi:IS66 family transposase [Variovorax sp. ZT4R33]|uniref:IS66 family transposase n=1 Tax=Variovorax sp. ZT4R33 TaxID=3443743 RepID=UPI003F4802DD